MRSCFYLKHTYVHICVIYDESNIICLRHGMCVFPSTDQLKFADSSHLQLTDLGVCVERVVLVLLYKNTGNVGVMCHCIFQVGLY